MKTSLFFPSDADNAIAILAQGGLVAVPTETVYGLAAKADDETAVKKIFTAKNRPAINPLIIHVNSRDMAKRYAAFSPLAVALADAFWPGPLTLILPKTPDANLAPSVTAGLDTVAIRYPSHPIMQGLITALDTPLAAPSANRSGKLSPTNAAHVLRDMDGRIDAVIDDGDTNDGLESSVVEVTDDALILLRHGALPLEILESAFGNLVPIIDKTAPTKGETIRSPGQLFRHYAPETALVLDSTKGELILDFHQQAEDRAALDLSVSGDLRESAHHLFAYLDKLDTYAKAQNIDEIHIAPIPNQGIGRAINDRLSRAAKSAVKEM